MTPALPDILKGVFLALSSPSPPEASGEFTSGRVGIVALLSVLAAREAERGVAVRVEENAMIRTILGDPPTVESALDWTALDRVNATLRERLIVAHIEVERRGDAEADGRFLALYTKMAAGRRLDMPGG